MVLPSEYLSNLSPLSNKLVLVTGGAGFLGRHICELLIQAQCKVKVFDVITPKEQDKINNVQYIVGNLLSLNDVSLAISGCYCVFHVASPSPTSNNPDLFYKVNVEGTKNVIQACLSTGVNKLVYTSSASVVFDGNDQLNYDETAPNPLKSMDAYTKTKLQAEQIVLKANNNDELCTCALRPHGIFGPRDPHMVPAMGRVGSTGKSKYQIGDGTNLVDFTYVENVAYAHALAAVHLQPGAKICGQEYFITNKQPISFWEFFTIHFKALGYVLPKIPMPVKLLKPLAQISERLTPLIHKIKPDYKPTFTVQAINYAGVYHYYNCNKASRDFNYYPAISMEEGIKRTIQHFQPLKNPKPVTYSIPKYSANSQFFNYIVMFLLLIMGLFVIFSKEFVNSFPQPTVGTILLMFILFKLGTTAWSSTSFGEKLIQFTEYPDLKGKYILITGGNKGIGYSSAIEFVKLGAYVILACRDKTRAESAVQSIKQITRKTTIEYLPLDLASLQSVRDLVLTLNKRKIQLDILINNAGAMIEKSKTIDGLDSQFQCNYLSHYYLTHLLIESKLINQGGKIVQVSSIMHFAGHINFDDILYEKSNNRMQTYNDTKLMQIAHTIRLQKELNDIAHKEQTARITVLAVNPGAVATDFIGHFLPNWLMVVVIPLLNLFLTKSASDAAHTILHAAVGKQMINVGGYYLDNCKVKLPSIEARDEIVQDKLWQVSKKLCKLV